MTTGQAAIAKRPMSILEFRKHRKPPRNVHTDVVENLSTTQQLAVWITTRVGTMGFFLIILTWTVSWLGWNFFAPASLRFDPPMGFIFYLFISNVVQILLMPLIMVGQNIQSAHSEARAEHDLEINVKAEQEIELVLAHLEHQNEILMDMVQKLGIDVRTQLAKPQ
jgi:uncharacterized membrane protein